jgi:hypothetical protein
VRGFLAAVVRKKLGLKLDSNKTDGDREYPIDGGGKSDSARNSCADKKVWNAPSANDLKSQNDKVQLGGGYIGVQTEKSVRVIEPAKPTDCTNDDECMDYSGLPKSTPARHGLRSLRKPFLGLSITTPLPW